MSHRAQRDLAALTAEISDFNPDAVSLDQARQLLAAMVSPVTASESCPLVDALERVLATPIIAPIDVPAHDNAAMDGYSVRASDLLPHQETRLEVVADALAGRPCPITPPPGTAVRIMTGAVLPTGHDTVIPHELCTREGHSVGIPAGQTPQSNRRIRGEDLQAGQIALPAGTRLGPAELGLIASIGQRDVDVRRRVRVAFFSSGDELRAPGEPLAPGQIYDSNRYSLLGLLRRLDVEAIDLGIVADQPQALEQVMANAASGADLIVSSAGVASGSADFTMAALQRLGEGLSLQLLVRPGRPLALGRVAQAIYVGLPGNPVAAMITFLILVREAIQSLAGATPRPLPTIRARLAEPIRKRPGRTEFIRGRFIPSSDKGALLDEPRVATTGHQGSGILRSMTDADCLIVLAAEQGSCASGDWVSCVPMVALLSG